MGVTWGVVAYPENHDRDELISAWKELGRYATDDYELNIVHGTDVVSFHAEETGEVTVAATTAWPGLLTRLNGLSCGDGSYDQFEQLFDGYELFVPYYVHDPKIVAPGSVADGLRSASIDDLYGSVGWTAKNSEDLDLARLAGELRAAALLADEYRMMIRVNF
ncbi:hypothetical protein FKR81_01360 [Lentzea tibetensis]|uniref:Uncharacterized protein n=1 Tax=Lentzea tibetensis TaxID=2591470 RepID=A0A563F2P8_9PSEU|nr:hypothetical protein [Lentzea tibetensis]TWP54235.1 hypothetical protein FKR81_01360 [Lentzea tibetensis]